MGICAVFSFDIGYRCAILPLVKRGVSNLKGSKAMEVKIPEPKYIVETVTLEEIDKRDEHNRIKSGLLYGSRSAYRWPEWHLNGPASRDHPSGGWPANSATRW